MTTETFVKDIKPGLKNLNLIFIVLETGGSAGAVGPLRAFSGLGARRGGNITSVLNLHPSQQGAPQDCSRPVSSPPPGELQCRVDGWNACQIQASSASWASSHTGPSPWCWPLPHLPQGFDFALFVHLFPHSTNI